MRLDEYAAQQTDSPVDAWFTKNADAVPQIDAAVERGVKLSVIYRWLQGDQGFPHSRYGFTSWLERHRKGA